MTQATLFVAGLGGHRASVNGRPLDPAGVRGTVTEWSNRTFYFADDVTPDLRASAASANGRVVVAVELYKHWYGLSNTWFKLPYGPRSLKAVLVIHHANGTVVHAVPTCSADTAVHASCDWRHGGGPTVHEDLHTGQVADARLAVPGWDTAQPAAAVAGWAVPASVTGPPGVLMAHPVQRSRGWRWCARSQWKPCRPTTSPRPRRIASRSRTRSPGSARCCCPGVRLPVPT